MASNQGMWCSWCGFQLAPWALFCPRCGLQVGHAQGPSDQGGYGPPPSVPWHYQQPSIHQWQAGAANAYQYNQSFPRPEGRYNQPMPPPLTPYQIQYLMSIGVRVSVPPPLPMPPQPHHPQQHVSIRELPSNDQQDGLQSDFSQQEGEVQENLNSFQGSGMSQSNEQSLIKPSHFHQKQTLQQPPQQNYSQQEHPGQHQLNRFYQVHEQSAQNRTPCQVHQNKQKSYISTHDENHHYDAQARQSGTQKPQKEQANQQPTEWQGNAVKLSEPPEQQILRNGQEKMQIEEQIQEPEQRHQHQQQEQEKPVQEPGSETKHMTCQQEIIVIGKQDQSQQTQQQGLENQQRVDQQNNFLSAGEKQKQDPQNEFDQAHQSEQNQQCQEQVIQQQRSDTDHLKRSFQQIKEIEAPQNQLHTTQVLSQQKHQVHQPTQQESIGKPVQNLQQLITHDQIQKTELQIEQDEEQHLVNQKQLQHQQQQQQQQQLQQQQPQHRNKDIKTSNAESAPQQMMQIQQIQSQHISLQFQELDQKKTEASTQQVQVEEADGKKGKQTTSVEDLQFQLRECHENQQQKSQSKDSKEEQNPHKAVCQNQDHPIRNDQNQEQQQQNLQRTKHVVQGDQGTQPTQSGETETARLEQNQENNALKNKLVQGDRNQQVQNLELKQLREQLQSSVHQHPQHAGLTSLQKYKPVFGQQANANGQDSFAFEASAKCKGDSSQSKTQKSTNNSRILKENDKISAERSTEQCISKDEKDVNANRQSHQVTHSSSAGSSFVSEDENDKPPIPLPDQNNQKDKNIKLNGEGDKRQDSEPHQSANFTHVVPGEAGDAGHSKKNNKSETSKEDMHMSESSELTGDNKEDGTRLSKTYAQSVMEKMNEGDQEKPTDNAKTSKDKQSTGKSENKTLLELAEGHEASKGTDTKPGDGDRKNHDNKVSGDSGKSAATTQPEPTVYNKKNTPVEEYFAGTKKPKNKAKKNNKGAKQADDDSKTPYIPPGLRVATGEGVLLHFHTIVSPEFNFKPNKDKAVVVMGGVDFGEWKHHCVELKKEKDLGKGYIQIMGSAAFQISSLKGKKIAYKYQIIKGGQVIWDYIYKPYGTWDHILRVPDLSCVNGAKWHHYDDVIQREVQNHDTGVWKKSVASAWSSVTSLFGFGSKSKEGDHEEVSRLVHDRQLAALTYLPKWEGFVVTASPDKMEAVEAIQLVGQVCGSVMRPDVARIGTYSTNVWQPNGFDREALLLKFLSERINSFSLGSDIDVAVEDVEKRLTSALAINLLIYQYDLKPTKQQWNNLHEGLIIPPNLKKQDYIKLVQNIRETYKSCRQEMFDVIEAICNSSIKHGRLQRLQLTLPLLHFFRQDCKPYEQPQEKDYFNPRWWGVQGLNIDNRFSSRYEKQDVEFDAVLPRLVPLFEVDCLLQRSLLYLQLTPAGLVKFMQMQQASPQVLCCALHFLICAHHISREDIENLHGCLDLLQPQVLKINQSSGVTMSTTDCIALVDIVVEINIEMLGRAYGSSFHLVARCCELYAASYSVCTNTLSGKTRSSSETLNNLHMQAQKVLSALLRWLNKILPGILTYDGKTLGFQDEINIWHLLLSITYSSTEFATTWKTQLLGFLNDRIKKVNNASKAELFSNFDTPDLNPDVSTCLSNAAFAAIDSLVNETKGKGMWDRIFSSNSTKYGYLLSKVLLKSWPKHEDEDSILQHLLTWAPFVNFFKITADEKTGYGTILTEEAQIKLASAKSVFEGICDSVMDGSIIIKQLKLIVRDTCCNQFVTLCSMIASMNAGKNGKEHDRTKDIIRLIAARRKELQAIYEQYKLNECLVKMCRKIDPVDYRQVEQNLHVDVHQLQLCKVCTPATLQNMPQGKVHKPDVHYFQHQPCIMEILQPLYEINESRVFGKLWCRQAAKLRRSGHSVLSLSDVATKVWHPAYDDQLKEISAKLSNALISLGDIDIHFKELIDNNTVLEQELKTIMSLEDDIDRETLEERLGQIKDYYQYKQQSAVAGEMLKVKDAFGLKGDFTPMETLCKVNSEEAKRHPLHSINKDVDFAAKEIKTVNKDQIRCLKELAKCQDLINWIRKEIKDERELRVFVELAMNSAGETAMQVDRVTCFHRAATGYASFIFDLKETAGYKDLLKVSKKVWKALEKDKHLPRQLIDTQKELHWLRQVRESQGDVETSSLIQAEAINMCGVYIIGRLDPEKGSGEAPVLQLKVTALEDDKESTKSGNQSKNRVREYHMDELKDLQSKLTLVAGKTKDQREEQNQVGYFVEVFTAAQQLAETYEKLCQAGNILFSEWKAYLNCGYQEGASVHIDFGGGTTNLLTGTNPLLTELRFLREFMKKCLEEWYQYVDDRRSDCYHLNYFTTEQLVLLRRSLAQFALSEEDDLQSQVFVLLSAANESCTTDDIRNALKAAAKDIMKQATDGATMDEEVDAVETTKKREKAVEIVQQLSDEYGFEERVAWAAIQDIGLHESDEAYMDWCVEHVQDDDEIDRLFSDLQISKPYLFEEEPPMVDEHEDEDFNKFPSMTKTLHDVTHDLLSQITSKRKTLEKQMTQLWNEHLHSMKNFDVEDCLSLEHLGLILQHLSETNPEHPSRCLPSSLKEGVPNLIVRSSGDVLMTVLSLYMHETGSLPTFEEVLVCSPQTSLEEIVLLWRRAIGDKLGRIFCLVRADLLNYDISVKAEQELANLMKGQSGYRLVVVCSTEREDSSHIVTALDQYRREMPASRSKESMQEYLQEQFRMQADDVVAEEGIDTAACITHHCCNVEVIVSSRPGVGKTLKVQRYTEKLMDVLGDKDNTGVCITVPLQEAVVNQDAIVSALLPHQDASHSSLPVIYHLDVAPMVREGLDPLLFNLLILGGLCDSHGKVWRCKPQDLYVVEMTDFALQQRNKMVSRSHQSGPFYAVLPCITCRSPQEVLTACQWEQEHDDLPQGWHDGDPKVDDQEFSGPSFQRAFQYLVRYSRHTDLDTFEFDDEIEGDDKTFLTTLLSHCGVEDPSWAELCHFAQFLSIQLDDCQNSVFCNPAFHDIESGLRGFKTFVVHFMIKMAMDFATPSLNMSEESPSRAAGTRNVEEVIDEEDLPQELEVFQLRRRWETSVHPYIFFNHDRVSMTFMGFYIDRNGSLRDPNTQAIIEPNIMSPQLRKGLQANRVELSKNFDQLPRWKKLQQLGMVLGVEYVVDPDETYELTTDNVMKMLAIHMRFRCGIPVVIMGETGCGKTRLIRFLCHLQGGLDCEELNNMILMKVHGGTTSIDIRKKITRAQEIAKENKEKYQVDTVLFFDEANTTEAIGLIKEIMCDGRANGQHIDMADGTLKIVAACNPYRRHTPAMIERLEAAGLGYHVAAEDTQERLGEIPLRELVYRVQALPPSMLPLVWDFGQLNAEVEAKYIRQIVQRYVNTERLMATPNQAQVITDVLSASQQFMRDQENECSFVSLRDVERCLEVLVWFHDHMDGMLRPLLDAKAEQAATEESEEEDDDDQYFDMEEYDKLDDLTTSLVLAIGVCYHACLQESRQDYRETVADIFDDPCEVPGGAGQILEEITRCQDIFLDQVNLDDNIARNSALKENVFMMVVCIELRIPLFLVGKPGSSKSLAKTIVADAMQGESARSSELFKHLKQVHMTSFQCSPLSTPEGIVGTFRQCSKFQEKKDLDKFVSVVVLDEVGLAEDSPRMPLKTLHPLLETGSEEDEEEPDPYKKVAFIGLSNWALDPAKMNRGILVSREEPDLEELVETARGICSTDLLVLELIEPLITSLAKAYLKIYEEQSRKYFGLRDYYSLIKMVYQFAKTSMYAPTWAEIVHSVRRNFGGLPNAMDPVTEFKKQPILSTMSNMEPTSRDPDCSPAGLLRASLDRDTAGHGESRYLLILTENYAALPILQQQLLHQQDAITIFGSSFPYDQEYTQICRNINRIKICMETGRTVVLLNLENLYESLYDALNQYYVYFGGQRYVDLGLGTHRVKCRVHKDFRLIVIADKDVVYKRFPTPLINRLEKHFLATSTMLSKTQLELLEELKKWVEDFASINKLHQHQKHTFQESDAFVGYHGDTLASLVFRVCNEIDVHEGDQEWRNLVCDKVKALLLQCATPDSVMRLGESRLLARDVEQIQNDYFRQDHTSLVSYLEQQLRQRVQEEGSTQDVMAHVTTHSRLLGSRDCTQLQNTLHIPVIPIFLQNFHTEQQFCSEIRDFYTKCKEHAGLLLVQCDDGHINNQLIACASYCVQDEKTQAKEDASKNGTNHLKPAHVVFIIQLATEGKGFTGFRGTGAWTSFHIDDLQPAQPNRPEISNLRGLGIKNIFQRDPDLANALKTNHDEQLETETIAEPTKDMHEMDVEEIGIGVDVAEDRDSEELSPVAQKGQTLISHRQKVSKDLNFEKQAMSGLAPMAEDLSTSEVGPAVIDVTRLLQDSIHSAASRISDSERRAERTTERITLLMQLFSSEQVDCKTGNLDGETEHSGVQSFLLVIKQRFFQLICEREEQRGGLVDSWLTTEALRVDDVQKSGTFRKAIWHRLISIVSPLLAELIAYCDCNDNLSLLLEHGVGHWQNQLWLAILADPKVSPIRYEDFLSPMHNVLREKALVRVLGISDKPVTAKLPFSWLLKEYIETVHAQALDLRALNDNNSLGRIFQNLVIKSPWHELLNQQIPAEVQERFIQMYLMDFIRMTYKTNFEKDNVESELECVYQALDITTQLTRRQLETPSGSNKLVQLLVAVHMSYAQIQNRLSHFARLVELYPKLLDDSNVQQLKRQDGQMVLDATAIRFTIESLAPESRCWKDRHYQQRWFSRVEAAKPIIESIIQTIIHGPKNVYGEATLGIVSEARDMWEKISVLRLFLEHICPPNLEVEEVLSNQALLLWKTLRNNKNGMKTLDGIKSVENVLKVCCTKASKKHFKMGVDDCPLCQKADINQPVELPCGKICCKDCILKWFRNSNSRGCPSCKEHIPEDYALEVTTDNREAIWKYNAFRQRCNAFFMDVVSQLCFANGTPPTCEVVERLMTYVTKETEMKDKKLMQTKRLTAFQGDGIDPSPVIRSVLLQLLLQSNLAEVQKYISQYLEQAQHVLVKHKTQDIIEVCMLFVHCLEDSFHREIAKHDNPCLGLIEMATDKLRAAKTWLEGKAPDDDVTVEYLIAIAGARFGLVATAQFLHDAYCQNNEEQELFDNIREVDRLLDEAWELCGSESNSEAHLFLVRQLCHCYGTNTMEAISQYRTLSWVTPQELIPQNEECPDRYVVCGGAYCSIREATAQAAVTGQFTAITKALKGCSQQPASQREVAVLLCLFREVTLSYAAQEEEANQEIKQKIKGFIQKESSVQQKEFAKCLIENRYKSDACNQLVIATGQSIFHQSLVAMVMHAIITFQCAQQQPAIGPLVNLLQNTNQMQNSFLPTMPEDNSMEAKKAIDKAAKLTGETYEWYKCPNGHLYTIGDCGRPYVQSQCKECGANIGGLRHELTQGNIKAEMTDTTMHGHVLGEARGRTAKPTAERHLSPIAVAILRVLMHSVMMGAAVTNPQDVQGLIDRQPEAVGEFLWQHIQADMHLLAASCGKSLDDCLFIVHLVLHRIATKKPQNQGPSDNVLSSKKSREAWEAAFAKAYIAPIIEKLEERLAAANQTLNSDKRFSTNPLMHLLYQQPTSTVTQQDMCKLHTFPDVWQYRPQVTIERLRQYLERQQNVQGDDGEKSFALLHKFLEKDHILSVLQHLPDIIRLQQVLIDRFHRRTDAAEATKIIIQDFLGKTTQDVQQLVHIFIKVWNQVRENIPNYGGIVVPHELCSQVLDTSHSIAMLLPTRRGAGVCSTALVDFLIGTHNEMIEFYHSVSKKAPRCDSIQPSDATLNHLVAYDKDKDLLPLVLSHRDYAMEAGQGTTHTFNLQGLQRQIEERFLRGRPKIIHKIEQLVFRQDSHDAAVFQTLRNRIPQKSLTPAIQHQILTQLKSLPDLSDCLAVLIIAIGFLVSSPSQPDMHISKYLHTTLSLPPDRGIQASPKAHEHCRLQHILSLWQTLAVEQARRNNQDPFDDIGQEYREDLDEDQKANLQQALRHITAEQLIAELYEYIILHLKRTSNQEQAITNWPIADVLEAYMEKKNGSAKNDESIDTIAAEIHGLEHFPKDLQLQHAVNTWKTIVKFTSKH